METGEEKRSRKTEEKKRSEEMAKRNLQKDEKKVGKWGRRKKGKRGRGKFDDTATRRQRGVNTRLGDTKILRNTNYRKIKSD